MCLRERAFEDHSTKTSTFTLDSRETFKGLTRGLSPLIYMHFLKAYSGRCEQSRKERSLLDNSKEREDEVLWKK